jgi:hypothetical protein
MRVKLSLSVPALLAVAVFVISLIVMLGLSLSIDNGKFAINLGVPTIGTYLAVLLIAVIFVFRFSQKK